MRKVKKGSLVYIPANVRLTQETASDGSVTNYLVTSKPIHCLVLEVEKKVPAKKLKIIYDGVAWTVESGNVYEIESNEEKQNASYIS